MNRLLFLICSLIALHSFAQPRYDTESMKMEKLDRGFVAIRDGQKVALSWRRLRGEPKDMAFDVYRNGTKLNDKPLNSGGTFFIDESPVEGDVAYEVRWKHAGKGSATYLLRAGSPDGYLPIPISKPEAGQTPSGETFTYSANDASAADVDGDGQYEIVLKWDPSNAHDNAQGGYTGPTIFDCYKMDGTRLWRINLGTNIRSGAHYIPFIVYDLDGDGKAEFIVKTADGTTDGLGNIIGQAGASWVEGMSAEEKEEEELDDIFWWDQGQNRRGSDWTAGRILSGPEYLTLFNGETGEALATVDYVPERGDLAAWGDTRGNRSERYLAAVGYLDGHHASAIFCRGYYTRSVIAAWDWDGKTLSQHWVFDTNNPGYDDWAGQGNHNLRVADVDGDGCDEITYGSMAIDHDGQGLYNTRMGHGDAIHLTAFDPTTDRLQVWDCHENRKDGSDLRDARTGEVIFQIKSTDDVGRCMAADIDPTNPGLEMWSSDSHGIRNIKGEVVSPTKATSGNSAGDNTALYLGTTRLPTNFAVWWDGDLLREMLDGARVSKYDWQTGACNVIKQFDGCSFNNGTKSNPCLSADLLGDWREEVVVKTNDSSQLRIYVSTLPTDYRITCLMQDVPYRLSVAYQNVGYNQPPHTGFYIGVDKEPD